MPATPSLEASAVRCTEWAVSFVPEPATIGIVTASATVSHRVSFSASVSVGDSPVVPASTRPSLPCSWSQRARATAPSTSSEPSPVNGVTIAVATRPNRAALTVRSLEDSLGSPCVQAMSPHAPEQDALERVEVRRRVADALQQAPRYVARSSSWSSAGSTFVNLVSDVPLTHSTTSDERASVCP